MFELSLDNIARGSWRMQAAIIDGQSRSIAVNVPGIIGNSVPTSPAGRERTRLWKLAVATNVMANRGIEAWPPNLQFAITVGFRFYLPAHGNRLMDIENFLKPTLDALAAGLFAPYNQDWQQLARWDFDDSRFQHLLTHRLGDTDNVADEGVMLHISAI